MTLLTLYARKECPQNPVLNLGGSLQMIAGPKDHDVVIYRDKGLSLPFVRYPWDRIGNRPDRRFKTIAINCYFWRLEWAPDFFA